ncbi:MAG: EamA family transporter [Candidatus Zixiibacteriota bacterium]
MTALVYIVLCVIWGSTWMAIKLGLADAPPLWAASIRFALAVTILTAIVKVKGLAYPKGVRDLFWVGHPGLFMYCASYAMVYFAERHINSAMTAVLFASFPVFVAVLSAYRLKTEQIHGAVWLGLVLSFAGVVLISYDSLQTSGELFLGSVLALGASFASAWGLIQHKKYAATVNIVVAANVQMFMGGILLVLGALLFENWSNFAVTSQSVGSIIYLAVFGTVVAFLGYYWLLTHTKAVTVSLIAFITPLVAILIGVVFGDETLSTLTLVGAAAILAGVAMVVRK